MKLQNCIPHARICLHTSHICARTCIRKQTYTRAQRLRRPRSKDNCASSVRKSSRSVHPDRPTRSDIARVRPLILTPTFQRFHAVSSGRFTLFRPLRLPTIRHIITWQAEVREYHRVFDYFAIMSVQFAQKSTVKVELCPLNLWI